MIISTFRAVFRTPGACQFANSHVILNRANQLKGYRCYHGINIIGKEAVHKGIFDTMDWNKKGKSGPPVWRPISTQSSQSKEISMDDAVTEPRNVASIEQGKNVIDEAESMVVSPSSTYCNDILKDSKDVSGDSPTTTTARNIAGIQDKEKITLSEKKHAVSVEVGSSVMRFIKGTDGSTQKDIENMGVKIQFPKHGSKGQSIVIRGDSMDDISKASQKIQSIIYEAAKSPILAYSHFISFPLAIHPEFVDKVTRFQSSILGCDNNIKDVNETMDVNSRGSSSGDASKVDQPDKIKDDVNRDIHSIPVVSYAPKVTKSTTLLDRRIDDSLFLKPQRLHLTIVMLKLWNTERIRIATDVLQGVCSEVNEVLGNQPLFVRLKGLGVLRGSKAKAQVLFAPIEEVGGNGRLKRACQIITDAYVRAGLVFPKDAQQDLKLHVTLMNTTSRHGKWKQDKRSDSFDATDILKQFGTEEWGEYHIREAHLSQRLAYDDNGYYHCCTSIPLPRDTPQTNLEETPMADTA